MQQEKVVEIKNCRHCGTSFPITDKDLEFYEKVSPVFNEQKYLISTPTLCPDCRQQRRLSFRNERKLYKRKCDLTGKDIISIYAPCEMKGSMEVLLGCSPDKPFKVYEQFKWWSDKWDPMDYGRDFDFSRPFFEQFGELMREVPRPALLTAGNENSEFTNYVSYLKDCYFMFDSPRCENCYYGNNVGDSKNCIDVNVVSDCENVYECVDCIKCFNLYFSQKCDDCRDSYFLNNCKGCSNCIGCYNLTNKQYYVENKFIGKEEFKKEYFKIQQNLRKYDEEYKEKSGFFPKKYAFLVQSENVSGDSMFFSKNCHSCFDGIHFEDCKFCSNAGSLSDCYDCRSIGGPASRSYEVDAAMECENVMFSTGSWGSFVWYSDLANGNNLFGCIGLHNNESYCILNKQYTKEEYEALVPKIIEHMKKTGEWGEFFPSSLSPFGYNETVAQEYYPLERRDVLTKRLYNWSDYEAPFPRVEKIIPAAKLREDITKIPDDILNWAIECEVTRKPFRIIKQELEFYRKHNLPIPRRHPDQRHLDRMSLRNPRKLFERKCDKCGVEMMTTYAPERPEIVYCESCYNKEIN